MPILDQGINLLRFVLTFVFVFVIWPNLMFRLTGEDWVERFFSGFIRMVALTIVLVYLLVIIKLYELLTVFFSLVAITVFLRLVAGKPAGSIHESVFNFILWIYDFLDGRVYSFSLLQARMRAMPAQMASAARNIVVNGRIVDEILLAAVLLAAAYMRFMTPLLHAAPLMSDSTVSLAWIKYIEQQTLFRDGIYPQGFILFMSGLHKFSKIDVLYILKYSGPLSGVLTTLSVYLFVRKLSGRAVPAIVAAFVLGVMGQFLTLEWDRQIASNSQEFALIFLLPAWYYILEYLETNRRDHFWMAMAAFAVIGFVHSLVLVFVWVGLGCLIFVHLLFHFSEGIGKPLKVLLACAVVGLISVLPLAIGLLFGRPFYSASAEFLTSMAQTALPDISNLDWLSCAGLVLFMLYTVLRQRTKQTLLRATFILVTGSASFLMYLYLGFLTHNAVLAARMGILWAMLATVGCGLGMGVILKLLPNRIFWMESVICFGFLIGTVVYVRPDYPQTYRMQYDSSVNQYLRISREYTATEWMMVSEAEGYALVLGRAWHMQLRVFLQQYNPTSKTLVSNINGELKTKDVFIFSEKKPYPVNVESLKTEIALREKNYVEDYVQLAQWIDVYKENHQNLTVYYDDPDITVYQIHYVKTAKERNEQIWGN